MVYQWKAGARLVSDPQQAGELLERLGGEHPQGIAAPSAIVTAARPVDSPIHRDFEWSKSKAARLYNEEQARLLSRSLVRIEQTKEVGPPEPVIAFVSVRPPGSQQKGYMASARVMDETDLRDQAIREALSLLKGIQRRFQHLSELDAVFSEIDRVAALFAKDRKEVLVAP